MKKRWFSVAEVAEHFGVQPKTIYSLHARGRLPEGSVLRLGRQIRFDIRAIEAAAGNRADSRRAS